jgi:hypothetical protein
VVIVCVSDERKLNKEASQRNLHQVSRQQEMRDVLPTDL